MIRALGSRIPRLHRSAFVHDSAEVCGAVRLGARASVWPFCSLRGDLEPILVGEGTNVQDLCALHTSAGHPVVLGRGITVGHRAVLHGCRVGDGSLIGMGAVVLEAVIGRECLVGAGALVLGGMRVPPRSLVLGSPAKVVRKLKPSELRELRRAARAYLRLAPLHRRDARPVFPS
ncbi:MAG: gamma carbonic anhydrase family protein [Elusimicrobiota bacterium]|jgi:carbonic anhydrase/acetyltransferase-like protein (isoleucine patch superfamily)